MHWTITSIQARTVFISAALVFMPLWSALAVDNVRVSYISDSPGSSAPYWIAKEAGFYKKYGLDTELIFINGSTRGIQSLVAGDLEFTGAVGTSAINGKLAGGDIFIVDSLVNTLPYYIIGKPEIKSPEALKGRTLATHIPGTSADFAVRLALRKFGIGYKDIQAVMVGGSPARVAAVINGQTDFTMVTEPGKIQVESAGMKLIIDMAKLKIPFQFSCTVATGKIIRERPETVQWSRRWQARCISSRPTSKRRFASWRSTRAEPSLTFSKVPGRRTRSCSKQTCVPR